MSELNPSISESVKKAPPAASATKATGSLGKAVKGLPEGLSSRQPVRVKESTAVRAPAPKAAADTAPGTTQGQPPSHSPWQELKEQAVFAFESGLLPRSIDSRQKAITIALMGREVGLTPMQSLCGIYVVNGMTAMRGSLMLRLIYERVAGARITVLTPPERAAEECAVEMQRPHGKPQVFRFTIEDAKKAGFLNKPIWQQHTATMLRWASIRTGARVVFADAIAGCYMEDELPQNKSGAGEPVTEPMESPALPVTAGVAPVAAPEPSPAPAEQAPAETTERAPAPTVEVKPAAAIEPPPPPSPTERTLVRDLPMMRKVTEKQVHRLYAIAHEKHWSRQDVGLQLDKWFHKRDAKELNRMEYDRICNFLLAGPSKPHHEPVAS